MTEYSLFLIYYLKKIISLNLFSLWELKFHSFGSQAIISPKDYIFEVFMYFNCGRIGPPSGTKNPVRWNTTSLEPQKGI